MKELTFLLQESTINPTVVAFPGLLTGRKFFACLLPLLYEVGKDPCFQSGSSLQSQGNPVPETENIYLVKKLEELYDSSQVRNFSVQMDELGKIIPSYAEYYNQRFCETIDIIAYYRPYHFNLFKYGIYIDLQQFFLFTVWIMNSLNRSLEEAKKFALDIILTHERFHYIVELYASNFELETGSAGVYEEYKLLYSKFWSTENCWEETLANYFVKMCHPFWDRAKMEFLAYFFERQLNGYRQANLITAQNIGLYFDWLERQILPERPSLNFSQILSLISVLPMAQMSLDNLPVYLLDDTGNPEVFKMLMMLLFPFARL